MKKIFNTSLIVLGIGLFFATPVFANGLVVEFEETPLFNKANFLPGESITRWAKIINNSGQTERIAVEAINVSDLDGFGNALTLEIKEGVISRYNGPLSQFFNAGEVYLSDLTENGGQTQYDFSITFYPGANNTFQGKTLGFDILIGFQGTEGGLTPGGGGGGGGFLPRGLTITNESTVEVGETSVTIEWLTSYSSTSQVIYAKEWESHTLDLTDNTGTPPKYGYTHTTSESDVSPKVTSHSITITGLTPNTTYYYRSVSHASLAISTEHSFTTLDVIGEQEEEEEEPAYAPEGASAGKEEEESLIEEEPAEEFEEVRPLENSDEEVVRGRTSTEAEEEPVIEGEETGLGWLLAAIGDLFRLGNLWWLLLLLIIIIIILYWLSRKKKRKEE